MFASFPPVQCFPRWGARMNVKRMCLLDHVGRLSHVMGVALVELDEEQFAKFVAFVIEVVAEIKAGEVESWRLPG
jgi:hypothetical protein